MTVEIRTRNCQIVEIPTSTHIIVLASNEDLPKAEEIVNDFFRKFMIIRILPKVASKELIKSNPIIQKEQPPKHFHSVISVYLQIKDLLAEQFTAKDYYKAVSALYTLREASVYGSLNKLCEIGKLLEIEGTKTRTFKKVHPEEPERIVKEFEESSALRHH